MAVAAVSGCVSVEPPPVAPPSAPPPGIGRPAHDEPPRVVEAPAREALEAATRPAPARTSPPAAHGAPERGRGRNAEADPPGQGKGRKTGDGRLRGGLPVTLPPILPKLPAHPPRSRGEVCDLGEKYGGWRTDSDQTRICRGTYGGGKG